jgi:flavin reductase (DIM6/NTAB) family NADH-FMN oxidoreductase RutF
MNAHPADIPRIFAPDTDNTRLLRDAFGRFATGITIVTCAAEQGPVGMTVNSFSSVSLDPALVLWAPSKASRRYTAFANAEHYAIHVLGSEQQDLCATFARDGFALARMAHDVSAFGVPLIAGCLARFECRRTALHDAGDHALIIGQVEQAELRSGEPLAFFGGSYGKFAQA